MADDSPVTITLRAELKGYEAALKTAVRQTERSAKLMEETLSGVGKNAGKNFGKTFESANQNISRSFNRATADARNFGFQINDIASSIASGSGVMRTLGQQAGQITQIFSGMGMKAIGATIATALLDPFVLLALAIPAATIALSSFFGESKDGAKKAEKALADQQAALKELIKTYADFLQPETKKIIIDIARTGELEAARKEAQKLGDQLLAAGKTGLANALELIRQRLRDVNTPPDLLPNLNAMAGLMKNFIATVESGGDPMENVRRALAEIAKLDMAEPNKGWKQLGDLIKNSILPNLKQYQKTQGTVNDLIKTTGELTDEQIKSHEDAKTALEEMRKIGVAALTDLQNLWQQYAITIKDATGDVQLHQQALDALNAGQLRLQQQSAGALGASIATSGMDAVIKKIMQVESGGKNIANTSGLSSAFGLFQFTAGSFVDAVRMIPEFANATRESILAQRGNVDLQIRAMEAFTKDNAAYLSAHGKEVNDATQYLAHFLGKAGAVALLNAPPGTPARQAVGRAAVAANPFLAGMNREDIINWAARKMGGAGATVATEDIKESNDALREQLELEGELTSGIDKRIAKLEEEKFFREKLRDATKEALEKTGKAPTEETIAAIRKEAQAWGELQGKKAAAQQAGAFAGDIQGTLQRAAAIEAENRALGNLGAAIDEVTYKRVYAVTVQQLMQKAAEDGTVATDQEAAAIRNAAAALAQAEAAKVGFANATKQIAADAKLSEDALKNLQQTLAGMATGAIVGFVQDMRNGVSAAEALYNVVSRIADQLLQMVVQAAMMKVFGAMLGVPTMPGPLGFASGGYTGDRPSRAPAGIVHGQEFVINAQATRKHRDLLEAINKGIPGYASGGFVLPNLRSMAQQMSPPSQSASSVDARTTVVNTFDSGSFLSEALSKPDGVKVILNAVRAQPGAFRQAMQA